MKYKPVILLLFFSGKVLSFEAYPEEFADFFAEREENIEFVIAGESRGKTIKGMVTNDSIKLVNTSENLGKLRAYLLEQNLTPLSVASIENSLVLGIQGNPSCEGILANCIPTDIPNQAEFVFDYDAKKLKTFVSTDLLVTKSNELEYHDYFRGQSALINNTNLYSYKNKRDDAEFTWNNDAILGLPIGHLSLDTQYRSSGNELDVYEALYDLEIKNVRTLIGYQEFNRTNLNSTDFLSYGADFAGTAFTIGSSQNLLKGGSQTQQRIYFFAPEAGQLEIYQGERLLINRTVNNGQQFISYDELPKGVYNITIVIRRGSQELLREQRQVVNNSQFSLPIDSFDYRVEAGYLDRDNLTQTQFDNEHRYYWRGALSYRPAESLLVGSSVMQNKDSLGWQLGGHWSPYSNFHLQYTGTIFDGGTYYQYAQMSLHPFTASVRKVNSRSTENSLSSLLYGQDDLLEWGVSVSGSVLGGTGYISYFNNSFDQSSIGNLDYQTLSTSWSRGFLGGTLSLNYFYNHYDNGTSDWSTSLTWSKTFNDNLSMRLGGYTDNEKDHSLQTNATLRTKGERWQASTTAGVRVDRDKTHTDISGNVSGHVDYAKYSAYGYVNDSGDRSISGSLSSTQIISQSGVKVTHETGRAFVTVEPRLKEQASRDVKVNYQFVRNDKPWHKGAVSTNKAQTLAVSPYNEIAVHLDGDSHNAELEYDGRKKFIMPGMHYQVNSDVIPLASQIVIVNDMLGEAVDAVQCVGVNCKNVEMLSDDGVYRVNYVKGKTFNLAATDMRCFFDPTTLGQDYISSSCLTEVQIAELNHNSLDNFAKMKIQDKKDQKQINANTADSLLSDEELAKIMSRINQIRQSKNATVQK